MSIHPIKPAEKPPAPRRAGRWTFSDKSDVRAVQIGVVATIVVHVLLIALAPKLDQWIDIGTAQPASTDWAAREFQIEIAPEVPEQTTEQTGMPKFVEANPNAPDNIPDKTDNVASQNQQAAQEVPTPDGKSDAPAVKGEENIDSTAIVSGQQADPLSVLRPAPPAPAETAPAPDQQAVRQAQTPLPGTEKLTGENPDGVGTTVSEAAPNARDTPMRVEGDPNAQDTPGPRTGLYYNRVDPKRPQARPTLAPDVVRARPSPLANREFGTENIGAVAYNAKWSAYGEYLQKFIESVDIQWKRIIEQSNVYPVAGTKVVVKFRMDAKGDIAEILNVEGSGGRPAQDACVSAIVARAPYGEWPEDMVGVLGESQEMTFTFHYN